MKGNFDCTLCQGWHDIQRLMPKSTLVLQGKKWKYFYSGTKMHISFEVLTITESKKKKSMNKE